MTNTKKNAKAKKNVKTKMIAIAMAALTASSSCALLTTPTFAASAAETTSIVAQAETTSDALTSSQEQANGSSYNYDDDSPYIGPTYSDDNGGFDIKKKASELGIYALNFAKNTAAKQVPGLTDKLFQKIPYIGEKADKKLGLHVGKLLGKLLCDEVGLKEDKKEGMKLEDVSEQIKQLSTELNETADRINKHSDENVKKLKNIIKTESEFSKYSVPMEDLSQDLKDALNDLKALEDGIPTGKKDEYGKDILRPLTDEEKMVHIASVTGNVDKWKLGCRGIIGGLRTMGYYITTDHTYWADRPFFDVVLERALQEDILFSGEGVDAAHKYATECMVTYTTAFALALESASVRETLMNTQDVFDTSNLSNAYLDKYNEIVKDSDRINFYTRRNDLLPYMFDVTDSGVEQNVLSRLEELSNEERMNLMDTDLNLYTDVTTVTGKSDQYKFIKENNYRIVSVDEKDNGKTVTKDKIQAIIDRADKKEMTIRQVIEQASGEQLPDEKIYLITDAKETSEKRSKNDYQYSIKGINIDDASLNITKIYTRQATDNKSDGTGYTNNFLVIGEKSSAKHPFGTLHEGKYVLSSQTYTLDADVTLKGDICVPHGVNAVIDLNGHTINRKNKSASTVTDDGHVFRAEDYSTLTIKDSSYAQTGTVTGGYSTKGGGILIQKNAVCNLEGGTICDNYASNQGGGVYIQNGGRLNMKGATVSQNHASVAGGIFNCETGVLEVKEGNNVIKENTSVNHGGGIVNYGGMWLQDDWEITGNTAGTDGGGIYEHAKDWRTSCVQNGVISGNKANYGGGVYVDGSIFQMSSVKVDNNTATATGGGILVTNGAKGTFSSCSVTNNEAKNNQGGGVATYNGTSYFADKTVTEFTNCHVDGNTCKQAGGGYYISADNNETTISEGTINNNTAMTGGGVYSLSKIKLSVVTVDSNTATSSEGGAGLRLSKEANIYYCTFSNNEALSSFKGGAITADCQTKLTVESSEFINNKSILYGTGIFYIYKDKANFRNNTFSGNVSTQAERENISQDDQNMYAADHLNPTWWTFV